MPTNMTRNVGLPHCGLYAVSDGPHPNLSALCDAALRGGAVMLQYRDKTSEPDLRRKEAEGLARICASYRVPLIINDDVELAAHVAAAGVHLGKGDATVAEARARLGAQAIIGVSCYNSIDRARQAASDGADYIAFGAFYLSPTKPAAVTATPDLLRSAKRLGLPLVAIGGITPDNAPLLLDAGADFLAVVSGVFGAADPAAAARHYAALFTK